MLQVLTGCSSGALGALLYADALADHLKELKIGAKVLVVVDAGWFVRSVEQELRWGRAIRMWNATGSLPVGHAAAAAAAAAA